MKGIRFLGIVPLLTIGILQFSSCDEEGCTDSDALNNDISADTSCGSCCEFSNATFYAANNLWIDPFIGPIPVTKIDLTINGSAIGTVSGVWPGGPGNCSSPGTVAYQFGSGKGVDWNATIYLASGAQLATSGTAKPNSFTECIKIKVY